ncbi:MAG: HAD family hydrolase [Ignavibacteria bacterium]
MKTNKTKPKRLRRKTSRKFKRPRIKVAMIYDFDGTLAPGNMQEYDFLPELDIKPKDFWKEVKVKAKEQNADEILVYLYLMLKKAQEKERSIARQTFIEFGESIELFPGVDKWFEKINKYALKLDIKVEHYVLSSGLLEMIEGTKIYKNFKKVFASSFMYSPDDTALGPGLAINYTTKTQFLFRINKGIFNSYDNSRINKFIPEKERYMPFENMIYFGDGETDVPCMRLIIDKGGNSIAVYKKSTKGAKAKANKLLLENRASFISTADYSEGGRLDKIVKCIIDDINSKNNLKQFK